MFTEPGKEITKTRYLSSHCDTIKTMNLEFMQISQNDFNYLSCSGKC